MARITDKDTRMGASPVRTSKERQQSLQAVARATAKDDLVELPTGQFLLRLAYDPRIGKLVPLSRLHEERPEAKVLEFRKQEKPT